MCYYRSQRVREEYITEANYEFREANKGEIILGEHNVVPTELFCETELSYKLGYLYK